ncbi:MULTISPECIES: sulfite exporter TauE/SafE family protein [unclassified Achromobacter]|uniref:sulfite exporter TauE/SafE family protein n=1 Tax=unclassified Achromobacter TaxID=2626865 RepID=UPI001C473964|nr:MULTISPECIES: sulfite exporter TauE/SafE family protein [unclassified Achromobacter]MBV7500026.1 sulfite exporter TauE/SafE family protein [Achromobacter sp. ACM05]MCG7325050.1 sulfite exporter TauE/SafE family protein [Achromobacter sp. ACRQX]
MNLFDPVLLAAVVTVFVLAGVVKGVVGLGLPTISMALLALVMAPAQAAALLIVPSLITNLWQALPWVTLRGVLRRIAGMQAGVCAGTVAGALWLGPPSGDWAGIFLGLALVAYAAWGLFGSPPTVQPRHEQWMGIAAGAVTGVITAATGVFVIPAVPYLQALKLDKDALIQAMGISFTVSTVALAAGLWLNGGYTAGAASASLLMLLPALAGMALGQRLRGRLSARTFKLCFMVSLALLGAYQAGRGLLGG